MIKLTVNGVSHNVDADPDTPLLWVIREWLGMTWHEIRLRHRTVRRLHRAYRRRRDTILPGARGLGGRCEDHHHRGPVTRRSQSSGAGCLAPARCASMRLLSVRADHGRGRIAEDNSQTQRRRHRQRDHQYLSLRHLSAHPRSHPYRRLTRRQGIGSGTMSNRLALRRRAFLGSVAAIGGGLTLGWQVPAFPQSGGQELGIWVVISPDDTTVVRIARSEMGQGTFHRPRATRRRRTRCRLEACARRIRFARREPGAQARLGRHVDWVEPRHPRFGGLRAQGWRRGSRHVDRGGGTTLARAGGRMHRCEQRAHAYAEWPDIALWRGRGGCGETPRADRGETEDAGAVDDHRQARETARHVGQAVRQAGVRHRRATARHAERRDRAMPGLRRQAEVVRRRQDQSDARRAARGRSWRQCGRRGGGQMVPGEDRARRAADRLGRRTECHCRQRTDRHPAERRPRCQGSRARPEARRCRGGLPVPRR